MTWALVRRFWFVPFLVGLVIVVLWQRNDLTDKSAKLAAADARVADVTTANEALSASITQMKLARIDNDAIALKVAEKVRESHAVETRTETIIEKAAANDPTVRTWADAPLPSSVREAIRSN